MSENPPPQDGDPWRPPADQPPGAPPCPSNDPPPAGGYPPPPGGYPPPPGGYPPPPGGYPPPPGPGGYPPPPGPGGYPPPPGGYSPPPGGYPPPPGHPGGPHGERPPNHLVWAILTTVLCCLPLGIPAIVFAAQVDNRWNAGDVHGAHESSQKARTWSLIATIVGVVWVAVVLIISVLLAVAGSSVDDTTF